MVSVRTVTSVINGAAAEAEQVVAVADDRRRYIALYAKTGTCKVSIGKTPHADSYMSIAEGNLLEMEVVTLGKVVFSGTGSVLNVIQNIDSKIVLSLDNLSLTYGGEPLAYTKRISRLPAPIFK